MLKKIKKYFNAGIKFIKSKNKGKLIIELKLSLSQYGLLLGARDFLHKKYLQGLEFQHQKNIATISTKVTILTNMNNISEATLIKSHLEKLDKEIKIILERPAEGYAKHMHYIIGVLMFSELPKYYIIFQTEPLGDFAKFNQNDFIRFKNAFAVLESSLINIQYLLNNGLSMQQIYYLPTLNKEFSYYFYRFILAKDLISYKKFYELVGHNINISGNFWCLSLPESPKRLSDFNHDNKFGIQVFNGIKHRIGWIGCALSYKVMISKALNLGLDYLIICEDDVEFYSDFSRRLKVILEYLTINKERWDIFSGLIADLHTDVRILALDKYKNEEFVYINKMVSTVCNIYNNSVFTTILAWDESNRDVKTNTIDRYLEASKNIRVITSCPFLVGHKEEHNSTLWDIQNTRYCEMITNSAKLLNQKLEAYKSNFIMEIYPENTNYLVSIAMASYNGEKYLSQQLDSILNQSYKNIEIIIVDDSSTDETVQIIREYQSKYASIKLFKNLVNMGVTRSFERAIGLCTGEYIALSDQDDVWFPEKIQTLLDNIGDSLLIHSDAILVDSDLNVIANSHFGYVNKGRNKSKFVDYLISNNVTGCTMMFSKRLLALALPIPEQFYIHDHYLAIIASFYGKITLLNQPLIYYRQHGGNAIGAARPSFEVFIKHCNEIANSYNAILLTKECFANNEQVELLRDYRLSMYKGVWTGNFNLLKLLTLPDGIKLIIYFIIITGFKNRNISKKLYNSYVWYQKMKISIFLK